MPILMGLVEKKIPRNKRSVLNLKAKELFSYNKVKLNMFCLYKFSEKGSYAKN